LKFLENLCKIQDIGVRGAAQGRKTGRGQLRGGFICHIVKKG
jgi:hypothetical protein